MCFPSGSCYIFISAHISFICSFISTLLYAQCFSCHGALCFPHCSYILLCFIVKTQMDTKATRCNCSNEQVGSGDPDGTQEHEDLKALCITYYNIGRKCKTKHDINFVTCTYKLYCIIDCVYKLAYCPKE